MIDCNNWRCPFGMSWWKCSEASYKLLDPYRGFRHVARNVYTFHLDPTRLERLVARAATCFDSVRPELLAFADFLERQASR